ncbi:hypothetical protein Naga_101710g2 [Nannochloropsis gaditana]|uniref:Uncharacterized protein n=1 Tax=Nannochloropsis gaditana TaxID=72520 RepID=W7TJ53_9STRA|nr:hypothetical protein Naga_101710g2 [Nannochloropsis gaditana]
MQATTLSNQSFAPSPYCPTQATHLHRHSLLLCCGILDQFLGARTDEVQGASSMTSLRLPPPTQKLNRASQASWREVFLACLLVLHATHGFVAPVLRHGFLRPFCARTSHRGTGTSPRAQHAMTMAAAKPLSGRSLHIQNGADTICYDIFYGTRKPAVIYLPCLFYPKNNAKATNLENW